MKIQVSKIINIAQLENVRGNNVEAVEITVICSVKNGEKTIGTTIESIIKQSFKEWEFIIVDDGSTDNTSQIIESYVQKDSRIKLFVSGGIGRGRALNLAIKKVMVNILQI
ncbi:glycosyltransferase family A protein [Bacillus paranthracis]